MLPEAAAPPSAPNMSPIFAPLGARRHGCATFSTLSLIRAAWTLARSPALIGCVGAAHPATARMAAMIARTPAILESNPIAPPLRLFGGVDQHEQHQHGLG